MSAPLVLQRVSFTWGVTAAVMVVLVALAGVTLWRRRAAFVRAAERAYTFGPPGPASSRPRLHPDLAAPGGPGDADRPPQEPPRADLLDVRRGRQRPRAGRRHRLHRRAAHPGREQPVPLGRRPAHRRRVAGRSADRRRRHRDRHRPADPARPRRRRRAADPRRHPGRGAAPGAQRGLGRDRVLAARRAPVRAAAVLAGSGARAGPADLLAPRGAGPPARHRRAGQRGRPRAAPERAGRQPAPGPGGGRGGAQPGQPDLARGPAPPAPRAPRARPLADLRVTAAAAVPAGVPALRPGRRSREDAGPARLAEPLPGHRSDRRSRDELGPRLRRAGPPGVRPSRRAAPAPQRDDVDETTGRRTCGREWRLLDPPASDWRFQTSAVDAIRGHSDYWLDPEWDEALRTVREPLPEPARPRALPPPATSPEGEPQPVSPGPGAPPAGG